MASDWTERRLQNLIATRFLKTGSLCVPNCGVWGWESDLVRVSPSYLASEYEIKVTRKDFHRDSEKLERVAALSNPEGRKRVEGLTPSRFWYATPRDMVKPEEVPAYAGLIQPSKSGRRLDIIVPAPLLHRNKLDAARLLFLTRGVAFRYWDQRRAEAIR
ncbi:hypothetical protein [Paludisphaera rhizosphaerae]|uniref:hypothetical protein n=1 Tax=Paludisphaera rhizosphaerae TaxID=2711216 RepID=UPI0013EAF875|nr:hypothetical protein [Paludisphaera rhizosphaerae]